MNIVDNGRAAIDFLSEDQVDLVILDWMMPVQDGIQTLKEIRLLNFPVKVLMLTAKGEIENENYRGLPAARMIIWSSLLNWRCCIPESVRF